MKKLITAFLFLSVGYAHSKSNKDVYNISMTLMNESQKFQDKTKQRKAMETVASQIKNSFQSGDWESYSQMINSKVSKTTCFYTWACDKNKQIKNTRLIKKYPESYQISLDLAKNIDKQKDTIKGGTHFISSKSYKNSWHKSVVKKGVYKLVSIQYGHHFIKKN